MESVRCLSPTNTHATVHTIVRSLAQTQYVFHHAEQKSMHNSHFTPGRDHRGGWCGGAGEGGPQEGDGGLMA